MAGMVRRMTEKRNWGESPQRGEFGEMFNVQRSMFNCHRWLRFAHFFLKDAAPKAHPKMTNDN
jgi:hypothetical protein